MIQRRGLSESLEQYAARFKPSLPPNKVRISWRIQGLRFLELVPKDRPFEALEPLVKNSICRIAPGISCPTKKPAGFEGDYEA